VTSVEVAQVETTLTAADRCDYAESCNAQAWVRVYLVAVVPLSRWVQFCGHHADQQPDSLYANAAYVLNERKYILGSR
jgi:hypothetical protein